MTDFILCFQAAELLNEATSRNYIPHIFSSSTLDGGAPVSTPPPPSPSRPFARIIGHLFNAPKQKQDFSLGSSPSDNPVWPVSNFDIKNSSVKDAVIPSDEGFFDAKCFGFLLHKCQAVAQRSCPNSKSSESESQSDKWYIVNYFLLFFGNLLFLLSYEVLLIAMENRMFFFTL
jgi:hypothetical protein